MRLIDERIKALEAGIKKARAEAKSLPEGRLQVSCSGSQERFYMACHEAPARRRYIPQGNRALICGLAQKEYSVRFLKAAELELRRLKRAKGYLGARIADEVYRDSTAKRRGLIKPYILPDEAFARQWQEQEIMKRGFLDESRVYETQKGEMVRSKSEVIIANLLGELGIPYIYEKPLKLKDNKIRYPDFTLLDIRTRGEIYLEHFGMLDDEEYRLSCLRKLDEYRNSGIYPGKNLLITYETAELSLDIKGIRNMLKEIFGV